MYANREGSGETVWMLIVCYINFFTDKYHTDYENGIVSNARLYWVICSIYTIKSHHCDVRCLNVTVLFCYFYFLRVHHFFWLINHSVNLKMMHKLLCYMSFRLYVLELKLPVDRYRRHEFCHGRLTTKIVLRFLTPDQKLAVDW